MIYIFTFADGTVKQTEADTLLTAAQTLGIDSIKLSGLRGVKTILKGGSTHGRSY